MTSERLYEVGVTQAFEMIHVVRASSKREARRVVQELTLGKIEREDPRLVETYPSGAVGTEKVGTLVFRVDAAGGVR